MNRTVGFVLLASLLIACRGNDKPASDSGDGSDSGDTAASLTVHASSVTNSSMDRSAIVDTTAVLPPETTTTAASDAVLTGEGPGTTRSLPVLEGEKTPENPVPPSR